MSDTKATSSAKNVAVERRSNTALRSLIDAMLERVREVQRNAGAMSPAERKSAEHDLAAIMDRVRQQAVLPGETGPGTAASTAAASARNKTTNRSNKKKRA